MNLSRLQDSIYPTTYLCKRQRAIPCRLHLRCSPTAILLAVGLCRCLRDLDPVYHTSRGNVAANSPVALPVGFMPATTATVSLFC